MTWATFWDFLEQLQPHLEWQDTTMWVPLPTDTRLALALLQLAMPTSLRYVGHLFGVGKAILEVCSTLQDMPGHMVLCMHDPLVVGFCTLGFSQYIAALDRTHFPIICPLHGDHPYYSQRGFHSMVL
ncbi:hypothetical protein Y1Q_0017630 [Alligator mississippiensis]|uniref:Uncharacterized protein n=1 Tax=Alligator mississippiensis TaxID=8496 RepID=A0A151P2W2_ALLMI|nr:hypothetical protein Y1Q_0017630 [Alligator mississippiensis]